MRLLPIALLAYALVIWAATYLLGHAYTPDWSTTPPPPPPRPAALCTLVQGQIKCGG